MQVVITPASMVIGAVVAVIALIIMLVYYQFFYKKTKMMRARLKRTQFVPENYIDDTKPMSFGPRDAKLGYLLFLFLGCSIGSSFLPAFFGVPEPYNAYIAIIGVIITLAATIVLSVELSNRERERNINTTYGSAHVIYPEIGHVGQALKRMKPKKEIELKPNEQERIVDELMSYVTDMAEYQSLPEEEKTGLRDTWLSKIASMKMRRYSVIDDYEIFIASHSSIEDIRTPATTKMIDETIEVSVQIAPMFLFYTGPANRILKSLDDDGRISFNDMRAGTFIDLFDLFNVKEILTTGNFTLMTKTDALLAEALHMFEERSATATEMSKTMRELDKAKAENEKMEFDAAASANKIVNSTKQLLSILSSLISEPSSSKMMMMSTIWQVVIFMIAFFLGSIFRGLLP